MWRHTLTIVLPDEMREYIDRRMVSGGYETVDEYFRALVRKDQHDQALHRVRALVEEGLVSGPGRKDTRGDHQELLSIARGRID